MTRSIIFFVFIISSSCTPTVPFETVGTFSLVGELTDTINGQPIADTTLYLITEFEQLTQLCGSNPSVTARFDRDCLHLTDSDIRKLKYVLKRADLVCSTSLVGWFEILPQDIQEQYRCADGKTLLEAFTHPNIAYGRNLDIVALEPRGQYRVWGCP